MLIFSPVPLLYAAQTKALRHLQIFCGEIKVVLCLPLKLHTSLQFITADSQVYSQLKLTRSIADYLCGS